MYSGSKKADFIADITIKLINDEDISDYIKNVDDIDNFDVIDGFHKVLEYGYQLEKIKVAVNKVLNLCYNTLVQKIHHNYKEDSVFSHLKKFNEEVKERLRNIKSIVKEIKSEEELSKFKNKLLDDFNALSKIDNYYKVKENILFPAIEKHYPNYNCLKIMWSEQDDVRKNLKKMLDLLKTDNLDIKYFHQIVGRIFFDINSLIFREDYILYPAMDEVLEQDVQIKILKDIGDSNLIKIDYNFDMFEEKSLQQGRVLDLGTGELTLEQIKLIFNHLPVDITYIDENDEVRYFSTPKDRTFLRTKSVIGRKVQNCHPHESVDVVNKIIESFKKGEKNHAFFWIPFKNKFLFIQYYAVVNEKGEYKGIVEVTQDISEIQKITGVKRLLDW